MKKKNNDGARPGIPIHPRNAARQEGSITKLKRRADKQREPKQEEKK